MTRNDPNLPLRPSERYQQGVKAHRWENDPAQRPALAELDRIHQAVHARLDQRQGLLGRLRQTFSGPREPVRGLYLWGQVGRGKTFLMDLLVEGLPPQVVHRRHFHRFMAEVHDALRALGHRADPLPQVADEIARNTRVLCLDECIVQDIGDAMILGGLLAALFAREVSLVTTSNTEPAQLYAGGLQRARFLPAIELIQHHCQVLMLDSTTDWRLRALEQAPIYQYPPSAAAERILARLFSDYAEGTVHEHGTLQINARPIPVRRHADNIAWFDFTALCEGPRAVTDYIALGKRFPVVMISGVPQFGPDANDPAKRFIHLVDEFYDRRVKLVLSAAAPIIELYDGERLRAEFERTASRLIEMQSQDYLASRHLD